MLTNRVDRATGNPDGSFLTEDEVDGTLNESLSVELGTLVGEKSILVTADLATIGCESAGLDGQSDGLGLVDGLAEGVLDVQVVD